MTAGRSETSCRGVLAELGEPLLPSDLAAAALVLDDLARLYLRNLAGGCWIAQKVEEFIGGSGDQRESSLSPWPAYPG